MKFPSNLRTARIACNLTQAQLAQRLGYKDRRVVSELERGKTQPTALLIKSAADVLNVSPCWLAGWERDDARD